MTLANILIGKKVKLTTAADKNHHFEVSGYDEDKKLFQLIHPEGQGFIFAKFEEMKSV